MPRYKNRFKDGTIGPGFAIFLIGMLAAIIGYFIFYEWLAARTHWPEGYFQCRGSRRSGCALDILWHSFSLLRHGGTYERLLFGWIWLFVLWVLGTVAYIWRKVMADRWRLP